MIFNKKESILRTVSKKLPPELKKTIEYCFHHSPYYKQLFKKLKIHPSDINTLEDFKKIPVTRKTDLSRSGSEFIVSNHPFLEWVTTSGTSTQPISIPLTKNDLTRLQENEFLSLSSAGITKKDVVLLAVAMDRLFIAGLAYYLGLQKIRASVLRCGAGSADLILNTITRFKPTVLIGVPSFLIKVGREAISRGIRPSGYKIQKIIAIGEPVGKKNFTRNNLGKTLEKIWKAKVLSTYASSEMATSFCECPYQKGGHYLDKLVYLEILDEKSNHLPSGSPGEIVVTPLGIEGYPLLRYATEDIAFFQNQPCDCGYSNGRLSPVLGRKSQMLKIKGTTVFLSSIFDSLAEIKEISEYFITINSFDTLSDQVLIHISSKMFSNRELLKKTVQKKLKGILKLNLELKVVSENEILSLQESRGSKKRLFNDLR